MRTNASNLEVSPLEVTPAPVRRATRTHCGRAVASARLVPAAIENSGLRALLLL